MECEYCDCRGDYFCGAGCGCAEGGVHLCFDDDDGTFLRCWSHAQTMSELVCMAQQVAYGLNADARTPITSLAGREVDEELRGWALPDVGGAVPALNSSRFFLADNGVLYAFQQDVEGRTTVNEGFRWRPFVDGSSDLRTGTDASGVPSAISHALVSLLG